MRWHGAQHPSSASVVDERRRGGRTSSDVEAAAVEQVAPVARVAAMAVERAQLILQHPPAAGSVGGLADLTGMILLLTSSEYNDGRGFQIPLCLMKTAWLCFPQSQ